MSKHTQARARFGKKIQEGLKQEAICTIHTSNRNRLIQNEQGTQVGTTLAAVDFSGQL
jgi:hypothetical protein